MNLESLLSSSCRRNILRVLSCHRQVNVMELVRQTNSTYNQVNTNLTTLQKGGIVLDERLGRKRIIRLNRENPKTTRLLQALKILENPNNKT